MLPGTAMRTAESPRQTAGRPAGSTLRAPARRSPATAGARRAPETQKRHDGGRNELVRQDLQVADVMDAKEEERPEDAAPDRSGLRFRHLPHERRSPDAREVVRRDDQQ